MKCDENKIHYIYIYITHVSSFQSSTHVVIIIIIIIFFSFLYTFSNITGARKDLSRNTGSMSKMLDINYRAVFSVLRSPEQSEVFKRFV